MTGHSSERVHFPMVSKHNSWLYTVAFLAALLGAVWFASNFSVWVTNEEGSYSRSSFSLALLLALALAVCSFLLGQGVVQFIERGRAFAADSGSPPPPAPHWPGFLPACSTVGVGIALLVCYHWTVGFDALNGRWRLAAFLVAMTSILSGSTLLNALRREWHLGLVDVGLGLITLGICSLPVVVLPIAVAPAAARLPQMFNGILMGAGISVWFWGWLVVVWRQQLDQEIAWTVTGRLIRAAGRMSFLAGILGVIVGSLMAVWPRLRGVAEMDHSIGRICFGVVGHLILLVAVLWSGRILRRSSFVGLAVFVVISTLGFLFLRTIPLKTAAF